MTHDPLCPVSIHDEAHWDWSYHCAGNAECEEITCLCDFIAEVIKREQEKATTVTSGGTFGEGVDGITDADIDDFLGRL